MKTLSKKGITLIAEVLIVCLLFSICAPINSSAAAKVKLNKTKVTLNVGNTTTLNVKNTKKKVKWSSSKKKVVTVSQKGVVKAKKAGTAKIYARVAGKKLTCKVTVKHFLSSVSYSSK